MARYPITPIAHRLGITLHQPGNRHDPHLDGYNALAQALHVSRATARRMVANGLTDLQADRAALAIGLHPSLLWPTWWADTPSDEDIPGWYTDDPPLRRLTR